MMLSGSCNVSRLSWVGSSIVECFSSFAKRARCAGPGGTVLPGLAQSRADAYRRPRFRSLKYTGASRAGSQ